MTPQQIKQHRIRLGFSQQKLADLTGVEQVTIARYESITCKPRDRRKPRKSWLILFKKLIEEKENK